MERQSWYRNRAQYKCDTEALGWHPSSSGMYNPIYYFRNITMISYSSVGFCVHPGAVTIPQGALLRPINGLLGLPISSHSERAVNLGFHWWLLMNGLSTIGVLVWAQAMTETSYSLPIMVILWTHNPWYRLHIGSHSAHPLTFLWSVICFHVNLGIITCVSQWFDQQSFIQSVVQSPSHSITQ